MATTTTATQAPVEDGRHLRRDRNRNAVVDAMLELLREGSYQPSAEEIATRSGVSQRSLFRYFDDIDDLCRAAIDRQLELNAELERLSVDPAAPLERRVGALVEQRVRLYETVGAVGVVVRLRAPFQPIVAQQLSTVRAIRRAQVAEVLGPELAGAPDRAAVLAAADVLCSFESYQLLRHDHASSRAQVVRTLRSSLLRLLGAEAGS